MRWHSSDSGALDVAGGHSPLGVVVVGFFSAVGRTSAWALMAAALFSVLVMGVVGFAPLAGHASAGATADPATGQLVEQPEVTWTSSLVSDDGAWVLLPLAIPLVVTLIVGASLWAGWRAAAWALTLLLAAFTVLAMLSIGIFILPVTLALIVACATVRRPAAVPAAEAVPG